MRIIAIDPGLNGAIVCVDWTHVAPPRITAAVEMPTRQRSNRRTVDARRLLDALECLAEGHELVQVVVEAAQAFPGQGASHTFNYGWTNGVIHGVVQLFGHPVEFIGPAAWKKTVKIGKSKGATATERKRASLEQAADLFGERQAAQWFPNAGDDGKAEAALMAYAFGVNRGLATNDSENADESEHGRKPHSTD